MHLIWSIIIDIPEYECYIEYWYANNILIYYFSLLFLIIVIISQLCLVFFIELSCVINKV